MFLSSRGEVPGFKKFPDRKQRRPHECAAFFVGEISPDMALSWMIPASFRLLLSKHFPKRDRRFLDLETAPSSASDSGIGGENAPLENPSSPSCESDSAHCQEIKLTILEVGLVSDFGLIFDVSN